MTMAPPRGADDQAVQGPGVDGMPGEQAEGLLRCVRRVRRVTRRRVGAVTHPDESGTRMPGRTPRPRGADSTAEQAYCDGRDRPSPPSWPCDGRDSVPLKLQPNSLAPRHRHLRSGTCHLLGDTVLPPPELGTVRVLDPAVDVLPGHAVRLQAGEAAGLGDLVHAVGRQPRNDRVRGDPIGVHAVGSPTDLGVVGRAAEPGVDRDRAVAGLLAQCLQLVHQSAHVRLHLGRADIASGEPGTVVGGELAPAEVRRGSVRALQAVEDLLCLRADDAVRTQTVGGLEPPDRRVGACRRSCRSSTTEKGDPP